jgi:hypothetical protein
MIDWSAAVNWIDLYTLHHRESFSVEPDIPSASPVAPNHNPYNPSYTKGDELLIQIAVRNFPSNINVVILSLPRKFELTDKRRVCEIILNTM